MLITDYQYFGNICFFELLHQQTHIYFDKEASFSKMSFKNRMVILSAQGPLHLTIPIKGGRDQKTSIKDIHIAYDTPWRAHHWKAISTCYKRAPYFEYYEDQIKNLYAVQPDFLIDFLMSCQIFVQNAIKAKWIIEKENKNGGSKLIPAWQPNNFTKFPVKNKYQQVFTSEEGFIQNLSILDWLFCVGGKEISKQLLDP